MQVVDEGEKERRKGGAVGGRERGPRALVCTTSGGGPEPKLFVDTHLLPLVQREQGHLHK